MPKASAPKAPWVAVWLSPQTTVMPGCVAPISGPKTWTTPCASRAQPVQLDAEVGGVAGQLVHLGLGLRVAEGPAAVGAARERGRRVVHGGQRPVQPAHRQAALAQQREGLRAGHLVDQVEVDVEDGRRVGGLGPDQVGVPDLLEERAGRVRHLR